MGERERVSSDLLTQELRQKKPPMFTVAGKGNSHSNPTRVLSDFL
jgi:hypothetical protein